MTSFVIDGYNLLYAFSRIAPGSLEDKRNALIQWLITRRPQGRNPAILVFDSRSGEGGRQRQGDLEIVFTTGESADDWIAAYVRRASRASASVVVTNDQGLRRLVRGTGARWMSADDLIARAASDAPRDRRRSDRKPDPDQAITDALRKEWLD